MWEVTGGSGPGGAGEAGLPGLGWTPEGRRGERAGEERTWLCSSARCAAAGAAVAWLPLLPWQQRRCQLANEPPSAANNKATVVNRAKPRLLRSPGRGQVPGGPAIQPSSPTPHGSRASPRLPAPPPASFPLRAVGTPPHLSGSVRTGGRGPACPKQSSKGLLRRPASPRERTLCPRCPQPTTSSSGS